MLEEGGLSIKRSHSERAPVERTKKSRRGGLKLNPPPLIFLSTRSFALNMGNRGSQEQQDSEGRCHLDGVHFESHVTSVLFILGQCPRKVSFWLSPCSSLSAVFPPFSSHALSFFFPEPVWAFDYI